MLVLHVALALTAFAGFTVAAGLAALELWEERLLKRHRAAILRFRLPSLVALDRLTVVTIAVSLCADGRAPRHVRAAPRPRGRPARGRDAGRMAPLRLDPLSPGPRRPPDARGAPGARRVRLVLVLQLGFLVTHVA